MNYKDIVSDYVEMLNLFIDQQNLFLKNKNMGAFKLAKDISDESIDLGLYFIDEKNIHTIIRKRCGIDTSFNEDIFYRSFYLDIVRHSILAINTDKNMGTKGDKIICKTFRSLIKEGLDGISTS